ncbi:aminoglycoside phosphotransferase family protein [Nocardioides zeicaulis]|uniref:Aminoglycoside phosphotransferase family protein n=1 Tax=Nocardioides zeicaulis TaxID=1776857 RepID=A0ABV6DWE7_9ACTN
MTRMHDDETTITDETVRRLVADQLPQWSTLLLRRLPPTGTDNQLFRLGDELLVRMPRVPGPAEGVAFEHTWLPRIAPHLPLPIPAPVALGEPGHGYPFAWTVVPWIEGSTPTPETFDPELWATSLGAFVRACREVPGMDAPVVDQGRGAPLESMDDWVRQWAARADPAEVSHEAVLAVWEDALAAPAWDGGPCWFHGDLHQGNLLVRDGRLAAVIDWGCAGRGDPAIELNAMWGDLPRSVADLYRTSVGLDEAAYRRGRGFALAPSISGFTYYRDTSPRMSQLGLRTVRQLVASLG